MKDKKKIHDNATSRAWAAASKGDLSLIEECQSVLKPLKHDAKIEVFIQDDLRNLHNFGCSVTYLGVIGDAKYKMLFSPITKAEITINWFLYGNKYQSTPQHFMCRCSTKQVKK